MRMRKRGAFRNENVVLDALEPWLAAAGFGRSGHLFHRCRDSGAIHERIEAIAVCLGNSCRTVWVHVSTKFPAAIELLSEVRPFTFRGEHARSVPGYLSDLACQLQLRHFPRLSEDALAEGVWQRHDGRLQRRRTSPAEVITVILQRLIEGDERRAHFGVQSFLMDSAPERAHRHAHELPFAAAESRCDKASRRPERQTGSTGLTLAPPLT